MDVPVPRGVRLPLRYSNRQFIPYIQEILFRLEQSSSDSEFRKFANNLSRTLRSRDGKAEVPVLRTLRQVFDDQREEGLKLQIKHLFYGSVANRNLSKSDIADQAKLADLRYPTDWYPATRAIHRTIHLHVGPTNSGKTYHALKRLEKAKSGIYAGPLRLLAHEVYTRLNANGIPCHLVTGDERVIKEGEVIPMVSCTVEMVPVNQDFDVAVIDEIQMIGNKERGWAWTEALLGLKAQEVHLCGEARTVPLIRELAKLMGDKLEIHQYERLSPLETMPESLKGDLKNIKKGDCIVVFSKKEIHEMRVAIQQATNKRVAIIYGDLPPETRAQQARLFNDPDNDYDILVASDAIGMGLNLSIRRIIFQSSLKNNGAYYAKMEDHQIKQIGGRAGRYRAGAQSGHDGVSQDKRHDAATKNVGLVTSLDELDFPNVIQGMQNEPTPVMTAGIFPTSAIVSRFAAYFPLGTPFSYILLRINELALMHPRFHSCDLKVQAKIADIIEPVQGLTITDRLMFCTAPIDLKAERAHQTCKAFAQCIANNGGGGLLEIKELNLDILDQKVNKSREYQTELEVLHKALIAYMWLGYRFTGIFHSREMAVYVKGLVQERIEKVLEKLFVSRGDTRGDRQRQLKIQAIHQLAKEREREQAIRARDIGNEDPPNGGDEDPNTRKDFALVNGNYLRYPVSEAMPLAATA
ncbi:RNA helicase [Lobaria immixta]|nr:RNA helicase [Lobaria immixta]